MLSALEGLEEGKWWDQEGARGGGLGGWLGVPETRLEDIRSQYSTHLQRSTAIISHFLELHPDASWRALVTGLDWIKEIEMADRLRHCCKPPTGIYGVCCVVVDV